MVFEVVREFFADTINFERSVLCFLGASTVVGLATPYAVECDRTTTGLLLGYGTLSAGLFGISAQLRESKERVYQSLQEADLKALKQELQSEAVYHAATTKIEARRKLAKYINKLSVSERIRLVQEFGLQGFIELPEPPKAQPKPLTPSAIPNPEIADIEESEVESVVNPGTTQLLESIATQFPKHVRTDPAWVDELCNESVNHDMSKRSNHHFYLSGGTQSGKSTLAGVLINKIAAKSQGSATVIGHDPKDGVTRWLCSFSKKFDGMEASSDWVAFATNKIDDRKAQIGKVGGACQGVSELFLIQDEVDSVYGGGKGFPGKVDKRQAEALQALWNYIIKFTAGLKCHGIFMGQSPLCSATGFSRPDLKNLCFIALGQTASYILDNPKDFINVKEEILQVLQQTVELLDKAGVRYALVVPTRSNPFVALIPVFDIPNQQDTPKDWYAEITRWVNELGRRPTPAEVKSEWKRLTGQELNDKGVTLLLENLGYKD